MIDTLTLKDYFRYIFMTATGSGAGDAVKNKPSNNMNSWNYL